MPRGRITTLRVSLTSEQYTVLKSWQRSTTIPQGLARRARMVLLVSEGMSLTRIAEVVDISRRFVYMWVRRFNQIGLEGLYDKPGRGKRPVSHVNNNEK